MGKFKVLLLLFTVVFLQVNAQVGCTIDGTVIYINTNSAGKFHNTGGMAYKQPPANSGCYYPQVVPTTSCQFTDGTNGYLVSLIEECPIDEGYFLLGFGLLLSFISIGKLNPKHKKRAGYYF